MALNLYRQFIELLPPRVLQIADVITVDAGTCTVELPGGGRLQVRGEAAVGDTVYVRDGVIESTAPPGLPVDVIEI